ncbi:hypothetical protein FD723_33340 (plasmid) [Nostoc sp. C052]|uniref:hypothetical protein n=1 Tax=Nostoc sp. C052 TaxID=2576902 RepID=UPI0015C3D647|nr:hypothetical protein [Nostoc sp. C052]QLE45208.1 hypothetical protein FD723_33340 [Nostoc sp. C052]
MYNNILEKDLDHQSLTRFCKELSILLKQADHETLLDLKHGSIKALGHADDFDEAQNPSNAVKITVSWSAQSLALTDSAPL